MAQQVADPDVGSSAPAAHACTEPATQPPDPEIQFGMELMLWHRVLFCDLEGVKRLLGGNPRPNLEFKPPEYGKTALQIAVREWTSTLDIITELIHAGAKLDTPSVRGETALHFAVSDQNFEIVQFLVSKAEEITHLTYPDGGGQHLVSQVERKKYFVNLRNNDGQTALHYAARGRNLDMIEFLISSGACTTLRDSDGCTPALYASSHPGTGAMRELLNKDIVRIHDQAYDTDGGKKRTCLHILCTAGAFETDPSDDIEWLLDNGANPAIEDANGKTAWELAWELACELEDRKRSVKFDSTYVFAVKELEHAQSKQANKPKDHSAGSDYNAADTPSILLRDRCTFHIHGFMYPNSWYHVNGNNRFWFSGLLRKILKQRSHNRLVYPTILHCVAQHFLECRESADHLAFREPSCSFERIDAIEGKSKVQAEDQDEAPKGPAKTAFMSLVMPYFHSAPYTSLKQRREEYSKFIEGLKYCCGRSSSTASKRTLGIHLPLTLDEYLNPALSEETLQVRNQDQVLVRYQIYKKPNKGKEMQETRDGQIDKKQVEKERGMQEEKGEKEVPPSAKLLTVQQAWIWYVNANLITAFPKNLLEDDEASRIEQFCESGLSYHAVGELLSLLVDTLDRPVMAGLSEPIFNVFEKSISTLSEQVNQYLKVPDVEAVRIEEEKRFFHEIGDIREELSMINSVLFQQEEVWKEFVSNVWPEHWKDGRLIIPLTDERPSGQWQKSKPPTDKWRIIARPQTQFSKFRRRLEKIDDDAQRVENSISKSLDLKAKHASIREAHSTAVMSSAVFGFTVITIIFTPLSFVVSLFALPIDRFQRHQIESRWTNEAGMYTTNYVGKFIATRELVSVTLTLVAMGLAIELGLKHGRNLKRLQGYVNQLWKLATEAKSNPVTDAAQNSSVCAKPANEYDQKPGETQWWRFGRRSRTRDNCRC